MNIKAIEMPAFYRLQGYLDAITNFTKTGELRWAFEVTLFEYDNSDLDVIQIVKAAYPESKPENGRTTECSLEDMLQTFEHELGKCLTILETKRIVQPILGLDEGIWKYLNECIDLTKSRIFEFFPSDEPNGLIGGLLGEFAFIICNENTSRCLILLGVAID